MNNANIKNVLIVGILMIVIGALFVAAGILMYKSNTAKIERSQKTIAVSDEIQTHRTIRKGKARIKHVVYLDFEYNDVDYNHYKFGYYDASMYEGKEIEIYVYEKSNGNIEVISESGNILMLVVLSIFGTVGFGIGIATLIINSKPKQNKINEGY